MFPTSARLAACAAALPVLLLCGGCGEGGAAASPGGAPSPSASPAPRPAPLADIAGALGCTPEVTVDAEELREGACGTGPTAYRMATFGTEEGRSAWLAEARAYGGTYLVGPRWVVTAGSAEALAPVRDRLGGTIESAPGHGSPAAGGPSPHEGHGAP
ncbi:hypothetical protein C0216_11735 [Streptomyces globosus]|uniref:Lipoprotein n=1 Tax=Streptomyces globosus TaxID=68209 RepID=A0A344TZG6_9ACTN|nr:MULTISPECIES: hypothetical protein [Streptomyces]AXE24037.1 hypothetical protein C0216_11735 [Streptomyces globosus]